MLWHILQLVTAIRTVLCVMLMPIRACNSARRACSGCKGTGGYQDHCMRHQLQGPFLQLPAVVMFSTGMDSFSYIFPPQSI